MTLSAYFKKKRDIVTMVPSFCPEKYTTFYYRKDYNDNDFPKNLTKIPNLVYGGLAFSNNNYIPLDNNIEKMIPDISIYQPTKIRFCSSSEKEEYYNIMSNAIHCRLSLDGKTIWNDFSSQLPVIKTKSTLFIHDFNLGHIDGDYETIKEFYDNKRKKYKEFYVEFEPFKVFYRAEEYHQNYLIKHPDGYCHITNKEMEEVGKLN